MFQTEVVEKIKTHILCSITFFFLENLAVYMIKCKNTAQPDRPQMTIRRMRIACWIVCLCIYCTFMYLHRASWHSSSTLTEVFTCSFLSSKAKERLKPAKTGHGPHSSQIFVLFYVLFALCRSVYSLCVNV